MHRRTFLAIGGASALLRLGEASEPEACPEGVPCSLPDVHPMPFPVAQAKGIELPSGQNSRLLWSRAADDERTAIARDLKKAYTAMAALDPSDPMGLLYQGWLHRYYCSPQPHDPAIIPGVPTDIHGTSAFLPWHRAFLYFHERLIQFHSGNPQFRIPVWDWESDAGWRVPWAFRGLPDIPNKTCTCERSPAVASIGNCVLQAWLQSDNFADFAGSDNTGGKVASGPHSLVHSLLGGYMADPKTAAVDPAFYSHHANVDRFWCHWWDHYHGRSGFQEQFPTGPFYFYDGFTGVPKPIRVTMADLRDISSLGYRYESPGTAILDLDVVRALPSSLAADALSFDVPSIGRLTAWVLGKLPSIPSLARGILPGMLDFIGKLPSLSLPVYTRFHAPDVQAGQFYILGVTNERANPIVNIGGFGSFGPGHHRLGATVCVNMETLAQMWKILTGGTFRIVYGPAKKADNLTAPDLAKFRLENGAYKKVNPELFEIQLPR